MATIITIHGTFSGGPEKGDDWWQLDSQFENDLRKFVKPKAVGEKLDVVPYGWSGENTESGRRRAAQGLLEKVTPLEQRKEPYVLIGHSHGGSVIFNALVEVAPKRRRLKHLMGWIAVGTPFVRFRKGSDFFARLRTVEQVLLVISILCFAALAIDVIAHRHLILGEKAFPNGLWSLDTVLDAGWFLGYLIACALLPALIYGSLHMIERRRRLRLEPRAVEAVRTHYLKKGFHFWHAEDEVVEGLNAIDRMDLKLFDARFLTNIGRSIMGLVPGMFIVGVMLGLFLTPDGDPLRMLTLIDENVVTPYMIGPLAKALGHLEIGNAFLNFVAASVALIVIALASAFVIAWVIRGVRPYLAPFVRPLMAQLVEDRLNSLAEFHVRQKFFGNDIKGEVATWVSTNPFETWRTEGLRFWSLPPEIAGELKSVADEAAAKAIPMLRRAIGELIASIGDPEKASKVAGSFTWSELLHTVYFRVPRFRKFVCYAVAHSEGFSPTEALRSDPDYENFGKWLATTRRDFRLWLSRKRGDELGAMSGSKEA
jgi:hypothetical protein